MSIILYHLQKEVVLTFLSVKYSEQAIIPQINLNIHEQKKTE